jgi:hypothetical protein
MEINQLNLSDFKVYLVGKFFTEEYFDEYDI